MADYSFDTIIDRKNTNSYKYDFAKNIFGTDDLTPMWVADTDFELAPFIKEALQQRLDHGVLGYSLKSEGYYQSIIDWYQHYHQTPIHKNWILPSPGVVPAIDMCIQGFTEPGDEVVIQPPVYYPFFDTVRNNKRTLVENPLIYECGKYSMDLEGFKASVNSKTKMLLLCSPHNPVGKVWSREVLAELVEFCLERDIIIVSDEIHSDLVFEAKHVPTGNVNDRAGDIVVTLNAPTKTFNFAGLSTSYVIIRDSVKRKKFGALLDERHLRLGNIFGDIALEAAYTKGHEWVQTLKNYVSRNSDYVKKVFGEKLSDIHILESEATYLLWLDCRGLGLSRNELNDLFVKKYKLGLSDGTLFGKEGEGFLRMNIGCSLDCIQNAFRFI